MFTTRQTLILAVAGAVLWLLFLVALRLTPMLRDEGVLHLLGFAAAVPIAWPLVSLLRALAALRPDQIAVGLGVALGTALLIDGCVFTWTPGWYAMSTDAVRHDAAYILWGAGVFLLTAIVRQHLETRRSALRDGPGRAAA